MWDLDWTGVSLTIRERQVEVDEQLMEVFDERMGLQHVMTWAHNTETGENHLLKIKHGPKYQTHCRQRQKEGMPFPGDEVYFLIGLFQTFAPEEI